MWGGSKEEGCVGGLSVVFGEARVDSVIVVYNCLVSAMVGSAGAEQ